MSAEPAKAKHLATAVPITISFNPASGYGFSPSSSIVPKLGSVDFIAPQVCWVWTFVGGALANVFVGEQSDHVQCAAGPNIFTFASQIANTVVTVVGTAVNAPPPPPPAAPITDTLKGTIRVGN